MNIICFKDGSLVERYRIEELPHIEGSITTSIGINPPRGTAFVWDDKLKKNVKQEIGFPSWEAARAWLKPAMIEYAKKTLGEISVLTSR